MQRVVRNTLLGLLTVAGVTACGDKVTVTNPPTPVTPTVVHSVTVSPSSITLTLPGTGAAGHATLGVSVDADAGVTNRTVTWKSNNTAVATVGTDGTVTAVGAGTTTVSATSVADPTVSGAASVTVNAAGGGGQATVSIASTNTTVCGFGGCNSVPANLQNFGTAGVLGGTGILDVVVNADANGGTLSKVTGTLTCGGKTLTATGGLNSATAPASAAEESTVPISLQFNTVALDANGNPVLFNTGPFNAASPGTIPPCNLTVSAQNVGGTAVTSTSTSVQLDNADVANVTMARSGSTASDAAGFPWVSGAITVTVKPALYSQRTASNIQVTLPNANGPTEFCSVTAPVAPCTAGTAAGSLNFLWTTTATDNNNVNQLTLTGGNDANGFPLGVTPVVSIIDSNGNDIPGVGLVVPPTQSAFRIDNQSPQPPKTFQVPAAQGEWVNGTYVFYSTSTGTAPALTSVKFQSCGDAPAAPATIPAATDPQPGCVAQGGVSAATPNSPITNGGANPNSTLKIWAFDTAPNGVPAATTPTALTNGTSTSTSTTSTASCLAPSLGNPAPWIDVTTNAGALTEGPTNTRYIIRAVETDKLGNIRCTDLATTNSSINDNVTFARAKIGSDKTPPTVPNNRLINPSEDATAAGDQQAIGCPVQPPLNAPGVNCAGVVLPSFKFSAVDNLSGFSATPVATKLTRFDVTSSAVCVIGSGSSCSATAKPLSPVVVDNGTGIDGYYTYTASVSDLATNSTALPARTVLVDRQAPIMGGIQVPATLVGGTTATFGSSATDNLDLVSSDYTLTYPIVPANGGVSPLAIRTPGPAIGAAFDNVLTTCAGTPGCAIPSFGFVVPAFVRSMATTTAGGVPQNNGTLPNQITGRVYDAASNQSAPSSAAITANNIGAVTLTNYTAAQSNGATFSTFQVTNAATALSNCDPGCATPANPTSVVLTATATGTEGNGPPAFQFLNPFPNGVSFYYLDTTTNEWVLIGTIAAPSVSDNTGATVRTFTWTSASFNPPFSLGTGGTALNIVAIGVNAAGDALASAVNGNITLNP